MKKSTITFVVAYFSACNLLFAAEWYDSYEKALEAIQKTQWQEALTHLNSALAQKLEEKAKIKTYGLHFIDYFPYLYRGIAHYHLGNFDKAMADLQKSASFGEVTKAGMDKEASGKLQKYLNLLKTRLQIETKLDEAISLFNQKQYEAAIMGFKAILKLNPNHPEAAKYLQMAEDESEKNAVARTVEKGKRERIDKEFNTAVQLFNQASLEEAERKFRLVLDLDSAHPKAGEYLNKIKLEREKFTTQSKAIAEAFNNGVRLLEDGDLAGAKEKFNAVLQLDNTRFDARDYLGKISARRAQADRELKEGERLLQNSEFDKAEEKLLFVLTLDKNNLSARKNLDRLSKARGESGTEQMTEKIFNDGLALFKRGDLKKAKEKFLEVRRFDAAHARAASQLDTIAQAEKSMADGIVAFFEGSCDQSIKQLTGAARVYSANANVHAFLAYAYAAKYFLQGEKDKELYQNALNQFNEARKLDANYKPDDQYISPKIIELFSSK